MAYYGGGHQHPAPPPQLPSQFTSYPPAAATGALPSYPTPPPQQTAAFYPHHHQQQPPARYQQPPQHHQQQQQQQQQRPAPSRVVPQQPKAPSQREVKRAAEQKAHDVLLRKTLRYLIAAQLSKFLPSAKHFADNMSEFTKTAEYLFSRAYPTEKENGIDGYESRRVQTRVINLVNTYMDKYGTEKTAKKKRARGYGDVQLVGSPVIEDEPARSPKRARTDAENPPTPTAAAAAAAAAGGGDDESFTPQGRPSVEVVYSSQMSQTRAGVRVDYGFEDDMAGDDDAAASGAEAKADAAKTDA